MSVAPQHSTTRASSHASITKHGVALKDFVTKRAFIEDAFVENLHLTNPLTDVKVDVNGLNVGTGQGEVFKETNVDNILTFRTLQAGNGIQINQNTDEIEIATTSSGTGNVTGPESSTDNAIALFNGTSGTLLQQSSSPAIINSVTNNMSGINSLTVTGNITMPVSNSTATVGTLNASGIGRILYAPPGGTSMAAGPNVGSSTVLAGSVVNTTLYGTNAGSSLSAASANNVAIGTNAAASLTTGLGNVVVGRSALASATTASNNVLIGDAAGANYAAAESNNILIGPGVLGIPGENNTIRIGAGGTTQTFLDGVTGQGTTLTGDLIQVTSGGQVVSALSASATLSFGNTNAQKSTDATITVTGAVAGDPVILGHSNPGGFIDTNFSAWTSAANTVTVRFNNYSAAPKNPGSGTFKVRVLRSA